MIHYVHDETDSGEDRRKLSGEDAAATVPHRARGSKRSEQHRGKNALRSTVVDSVADSGNESNTQHLARASLRRCSR